MPDTETWKFINTFAPWLAALGTFTAAATALHLARRNTRIILHIEASWGVEILEEEDPIEFKTCLTIRLVNDGPRDITVTEADWDVPLGNEITRIVSECIPKLSTALPVRLWDGDEAYLRYDVELFDGVMPSSTMRATVYTSVGRVFTATLPGRVATGYKEAKERHRLKAESRG